MSIPNLIDAHTHVQFAAFKEDADFVIQRALDAGIWMVNVGTQQDTSVKAVELANKYAEGVYATIGLHPIHTDKSFHDEQELGGDTGFTSRGEEFDAVYYRKLAQDPRVVAIGECGLDYFRINPSTPLRAGNKPFDSNQESPHHTSIDPVGAGQARIKQEKAFIQQIELAHEIQKPLMIHCREAFDDLIKLLNSNIKYLNSPPGIVHFFSGGLDHAKKLLDLGFSFTFGGVITFVRDYDEVVRYIPLDRILLETEPLYVTEIAKRTAELKDVEVEMVQETTVQNTRELLKI